MGFFDGDGGGLGGCCNGLLSRARMWSDGVVGGCIASCAGCFSAGFGVGDSGLGSALSSTWLGCSALIRLVVQFQPL